MLSRAYELDDRNPTVAAALREALVGQARGLIGSDPTGAEHLLHRALKIESEDGEAKGLLSLLEDHRRQAAVDQWVSQVRQLQSQGDLRAAAAVVEQGLRTFPGEARLAQLQASLKKGLEEVRRQDLEEVKRLRQDGATTFDEPTLQTYSGRLDDLSDLYVDDAEFRTAAEAARRSLERSPVPVEQPESPPPSPDVIPPEPVAQVPEPKPRVRATPVWQRALSFVKARPKAWGAGALAGLAVLLLIVVVSRPAKPKVQHVVSREYGPLESNTAPSAPAVFLAGKPSVTPATALQLSVAPGPVEIEAGLPGYQTKKIAVTVAGGAGQAVSLTLVPVVALKLQFPSEGRVAINNEDPVNVQDGQLVPAKIRLARTPLNSPPDEAALLVLRSKSGRKGRP
jgi:hypothetical protein